MLDSRLNGPEVLALVVHRNGSHGDSLSLKGYVTNGLFHLL